MKPVRIGTCSRHGKLATISYGVEVTGRSQYEVAHSIALNIINSIDKKKLSEVSRDDYLKAVSQAILALRGGYA